MTKYPYDQFGKYLQKQIHILLWKMNIEVEDKHF